MSFTQRYKKNIMDLLKKKSQKRKNIIESAKINLNNQNNKKFNLINIKYSNLLNVNNKNFPIILNNKYFPSNNDFPNNISSLKNKKTNKATSMNKISNKKYISIFKIYYRKIKNNTFFSNNKARYNYKMNLIKNIDDEINVDIDKNVKNILLKNDYKYKMINKSERLIFYNKIKKAHDDINIINNKKLNFNQSAYLFTPFKGIYQKMIDKNK